MSRLRFPVLLLWAFLTAHAASAVAQESPGLLLDLLGGNGSDDASGDIAVKFTLEPQNAEPGNTVTLKIELNFPPDSHTYSQDKEFSGRTRIRLEKVSGLEALGSGFVPDHQPEVKDDPLLGQIVEVFNKPVTWSQRFRIDAFDLSEVLIEGKIQFQVCDANNCLPQSESFSLRLAAAPQPVFEVRSPGPLETKKPVQWTITLSPDNATVGEHVTLTLAARIDDGYHLFGLDQDRKNLGLPTRIAVSTLQGLKPVDAAFRQDRDSEKHLEDDNGQDIEQRYHHNEVSFLRDYVVTEAGAAGYGAAGQARFQFCDASSCTPAKVEFSLGTVNGSLAAADPSQTRTEPAGNAQTLFRNIEIREPGGAADDASLGTYLMYAFLGGLILNVMPCVLPVIAIKVLSFVQQAGENKSRILLLNLAYSTGVVFVFLGLAAMTVSFKWGWGGLFERSEFSIGITAFVFVMALSLLGVFEIPIPGFVGNAAGTQQKEGPTGAFLTGIFATILATPCTGPFMGTALAWSVKQDATSVYLVWGTMGVGMATPYLLFGLFPGSVRYLPKPGEWMVTFKQVCGFILLGTVVFLLYGLSDKYVVPTLTLLLGLGLGLWMIGNLYGLASPRSRRIQIRLLALLVTATISGLAWYLATAGNSLKWEPYSSEKLASELIEKQNIVLVDFTADW
ncbi:MAG: cytochrome c biogenesis protein CcdA [Planctomycetaceae bacterium]